jgi:lipopolysaccharide/colanic/teichoic acid biosynthesis glycosyltransferase
VRRTIDVTVAAIGLLLTWPLLVAVAVAIRLTMGGPVLFRQRRSGLGGQEFTIYKFRTMRDERYPGEPDAERTPPLGETLRAFSLDELPQLWNVLRGDMSLIGPRPTLPEQVVHYSARQRRRLEVRPGITGYAQVIGRNAISWPERIELDIHYIDHRSPALDVRILMQTVGRLVRPDGVVGQNGVNPGFPIPEVVDAAK